MTRSSFYHGELYNNIESYNNFIAFHSILDYIAHPSQELVLSKQQLSAVSVLLAGSRERILQPFQLWSVVFLQMQSQLRRLVRTRSGRVNRCGNPREVVGAAATAEQAVHLKMHLYMYKCTVHIKFSLLHPNNTASFHI